MNVIDKERFIRQKLMRISEAQKRARYTGRDMQRLNW
jgi:hypothetical protein